MHNTCPGKEFWARVWVSFIEVDCARCVLSFAQDISASKAAEQKIKDLAFYDPLTGLANRRLLSERLSQSVLMGGRYVVTERVIQRLEIIEVDKQHCSSTMSYWLALR